jgi:hypothetical protein
MIAQRSRIMEAREAAGLHLEHQQFWLERDFGEPQRRLARRGARDGYRLLLLAERS